MTLSGQDVDAVVNNLNLQRYYLVYTGLIVIQLAGWWVLAVDTNNLTLEGAFSSSSFPYVGNEDSTMILRATSRDRCPLRGQERECPRSRTSGGRCSCCIRSTFRNVETDRVFILVDQERLVSGLWRRESMIPSENLYISLRKKLHSQTGKEGDGRASPLHYLAHIYHLYNLCCSRNTVHVVLFEVGALRRRLPKDGAQGVPKITSFKNCFSPPTVPSFPSLPFIRLPASTSSTIYIYGSHEPLCPSAR